MRNMAVLHSPAFSYPLPVLVRVLFNLLIFKGKILYYNKYSEIFQRFINSFLSSSGNFYRIFPFPITHRLIYMYLNYLANIQKYDKSIETMKSYL